MCVLKTSHRESRALFDAAYKGDVQRVKELLAQVPKRSILPNAPLPCPRFFTEIHPPRHLRAARTCGTRNPET